MLGSNDCVTAVRAGTHLPEDLRSLLVLSMEHASQYPSEIAKHVSIADVV